MFVLVRHCSAEGQEPEAELSVKGKLQAQKLKKELGKFFKVARIISSPFKRAVDTISPLAESLNLAVECDMRLSERAFLPLNMKVAWNSDWDAKLRYSFDDLEYKECDGSESNAECRKRALSFLQSLESYQGVTVIVSHVNLISSILALNHEDRKFVYEEMCSLSNPDVFIVRLNFEHSTTPVSFKNV